MERRASGDWTGAWIVGALVAGALLLVWLVAIVRDGPLAFMRPADDGYYYFHLVRSTWTGDGLTTDGMHATNGFHPLWFLVLLPFGAVLHDTGNGLVVVAQFLGILLLGAAVAGVVATARRLGVSWLAAIVGGLALTFAPWRGVVGAGVEGGLALALLSWLLYSAVVTTDPVQRNTPRRWLVTGLLAGLTLLSRLDTVFVVGCIVLMLLFLLRDDLRRRDGIGRVALVRLLAPGAVLVGGYMLVNTVFTGNPMPVTASLKSSFPEPHFTADFLRDHISYLIALPPAWLGVVLNRRHPANPVLLAATVGATGFATYLTLFGQGVFWWHWVSLLPIAAVGITVTVDRVVALVSTWRLRPVVSPLVGLATAAVLVLPIADSMVEKYPNGDGTADSGWRVEAERAGHWVRDELPADTILAMKDSGAFGYYTEQPVMNLDGVISSREFNRRLCDGGAIQEMVDSGVEYVAHHSVDADYDEYQMQLPCWDRGVGGTTNELTLTPDHEVYRSDPYWENGPDQLFVIWRFDPEVQRQRSPAG